jgi:hypothetical protein
MIGATHAPQPVDDNTDDFLNRLVNEGCPSAVLESRTVDASGYLHDHDYSKDGLAEIYVNEINKVSPRDIPHLEFQTRTQTKSALWFSLRRSRITGSMVHDVIRTVRAGNWAVGPALRQVQPAKPLTTKPIVWGRQNEKNAISEYEALVGESVTPCGIFIDSKRSYLAASPDGTNTDRTIVLEVKCPYSVRAKPPSSADYLQTGQLSRLHKYYTQVQMQMHVTGIKNYDFVVWTLKGIYVEFISYDKDFIDRALTDIDRYYKIVFSPIFLRHLWAR